MMRSDIGFSTEEAAVMGLSRLYRQFGFRHFRMSKFEEYDLYRQNKDFLLGSSVITFTDMNGKLMALKPDVTLSIVKGASDSSEELEKVYYSENVYRVDKGTHRFKEIMQLGLECIGDLDVYSMSEVIMLAKKSLNAVSERNILDISHMGMILGLLEGQNISDKKIRLLVDCVRAKNIPAIDECCKAFGLSEESVKGFRALTSLYGAFPKCISELKAVSINKTTDAAVAELESIYSFLKCCGCESGVNIDFSIVNDINYYNGVIFNGFIDGIPNAVLSGGRYDNLLRKLGKKSGAIGFAVYLDQLSRYLRSGTEYDVDAVLLYEDGDDAAVIAKTVTQLTEDGRSVSVQRKRGSVKCRTLLKINGTEVEEVEADD